MPCPTVKIVSHDVQRMAEIAIRTGAKTAVFAIRRDGLRISATGEMSSVVCRSKSQTEVTHMGSCVVDLEALEIASRSLHGNITLSIGERLVLSTEDNKRWFSVQKVDRPKPSKMQQRSEEDYIASAAISGSDVVKLYGASKCAELMTLDRKLPRAIECLTLSGANGDIYASCTNTKTYFARKVASGPWPMPAIEIYGECLRVLSRVLAGCTDIEFEFHRDATLGHRVYIQARTSRVKTTLKFPFRAPSELDVRDRIVPPDMASRTIEVPLSCLFSAFSQAESAASSVDGSVIIEREPKGFVKVCFDAPGIRSATHIETPNHLASFEIIQLNRRDLHSILLACSDSEVIQFTMATGKTSAMVNEVAIVS